MLEDVAERKLLIGIDQEGGTNRRLVDGFTPVAPMRELAVGGVAAVTRAAAVTARELREVGIRLDFAPVVDVDTNPGNPVIGDRSFSNDPHVVSQLGAVWIQAMQNEGVAACAKHFPGHGDTSTDSHHELPRLPHDMERLRAVELPPFQAAIQAGVAAIMSAHVVFEAVDHEQPATLSSRVLNDVLRCELGFDGAIVSDDLEMEAIVGRMPIGQAAVCAINAGIDLVLCCHREDRQRAVLSALGRHVNEVRAYEAAQRVARLHERVS